MNLIYITDTYINPLSGGIARITYVLAEILQRQYGHRCYSVYAQPIAQSPNSLPSHHWQSKEVFCNWVQEIGGEVVIVQSPCSFAKEIYECAPLLPSTKIINVFHGAPGFEIVPLRWDIIGYRLLHGIDPQWTIKQAMLQVAMKLLPRSYFLKKLRPKYARPYDSAHKIVVLSQATIALYQHIAPGRLSDFFVIPNACSFDDVTIPDNKHLHKEILVVSRLDDWHKRISEVLCIWEMVQNDQRFHDWTLRIIGDGIDAPFYKHFATQKKLKNVVFEGQQKPLPYYQRASICLVTSACEGFSLTTLEAQQCGCIPVVYDSFATARELITDGDNGMIIPNNNRKIFVEKLQYLMLNEHIRDTMSKRCAISSQRYSIENVAERWNKLLQSL